MRTTKRALENPLAVAQGLGLEQGAACHPPRSSLVLVFSGGGLEPVCLFLNQCGGWLHCLRSLSSFFLFCQP